MEWEFIVALVLAIPVILFPAAYVWYLNVGGMYAAIRESRKRRAANRKGVSAATREPDEETYRFGARDRDVPPAPGK